MGLKFNQVSDSDTRELIKKEGETVKKTICVSVDVDEESIISKINEAMELADKLRYVLRDIEHMPELKIEKAANESSPDEDKE